MSNEIQHKLYNYEVTPSAEVWQKIVAELDDAALEHRFPARLYELAIQAPPAVWSKIVQRLDAPEIAEDLSSKLYTAEVIPPVATWDKIKTTLDTGSEEAMPSRRRLTPLLRYAAAAVLIGLIAFGSAQLFNSNTNNKNVAVSKMPSPPTGNIPSPALTNNLPSPVDNKVATSNNDDEARNDVALEASKKTYAKLDISPQKRMDIVANGFRLAGYGNPGTVLQGTVEPDEADQQGQGNAIADRYIMLMTPDGNIIRMSKKLSDLVCCVSGEEQDANCKSQMEKWRKQLACSSPAHPDNFMDIFSLISSLQDN